jgi:HlyD family secretion protein
LKKVLVIVGLSFLVLVPVALRLSRGSAAKEVELQSVERRALVPTILASGSLTYQTEVNLVTEIIGRVREIYVKEGQQVKKGQVLLRLDTSTQQAQVDQLNAAFAQSKLQIERQTVSANNLDTKWQRYQKLREQGMVDANSAEDIRAQRDLSQVELKTTTQQMRQTEAQLKLSRENLAKTELRAPMDGRITSLVIKVGEMAVPSANSIAGSNLITVSDTSNLFAEVNVNEADVANVIVGQAAKIVPAAFPNEAWIGTVESVAMSPRQITGQSKTYLVKIHLAQSEALQFHTGMSCRAEISTRKADAAPVVAVPVQAVRYEDATEKGEATRINVVAVSAGKASVKTVITGAADDTYVEIKSGLKEGEQIAVGPSKVLRFLKDGENVKAAAAGAGDKSAAEAESTGGGPRLRIR